MEVDSEALQETDNNHCTNDAFNFTSSRTNGDEYHHHNTTIDNHINFQHEEIPGIPTPNNGNHENRCHGNEDDANISPTTFVTSRIRDSATCARIVLPIIMALNSVSWTMGSLIDQYLLDRTAEESGHGRSGGLNDSAGVPDKGFCGRNESDPWIVKEDEVQAKVSTAVMYYSITTCLPAFFSSLISGALVDIVGRKPALVTALVGRCGELVVVICIIRFNLPTNVFYLAYALDGIGGSFYVNLIACFSITADISAKKGTRILGIAILTVLSTCTFSVVNIVVGILIKKMGFLVAALTILGPAVLSILIAVIFLPETLPVEKQRVTLRKLWEYTTRVVFLYTRDGDKRTRRCLFISLMIFFTSILNFVNVINTDTLYQKHAPFCWDAEQLGYYSTFRHAGGYVFALAYLCMCRCVGCISDEMVAMLGVLFLAASFVLEAFVTETWQMYMVPILTIPGLNISHITRGVMSVLAGPEKQGVMFSSVALIEVACSLTAYIAYNKIYAVTVDFMPGFVFLVMACVCLVTFMLYIPFFHYYNSRPSKSYEKLVQEPEGDDVTRTDPNIQSTASSWSEIEDAQHGIIEAI